MTAYNRTVAAMLAVSCALLLVMAACTTKVENTYYVQGDHNQIKASDSVQATPNNKDLFDIAGSATGSNQAGGGL